MMKPTKLTLTLFVTLALLITQVGSVFAAPAPKAKTAVTGTVTAVTCEADSTGSLFTFFVTVEAGGVSQTVHIDQATALAAGVITADTVCNSDGTVTGAITDIQVSIDPDNIIPNEEIEVPQHPVGSILASIFSDVADYDTIMEAHDNGTGFGVIAQALWLTTKMEGDSETFLAILEAKQSGDYSAFTLEDGTVPQNWGQFKKAILDGDKKGNLGLVMSGQGNNGNGNGNGNGHGYGHDKNKGNNK